ncbi:hypothetical protein BBM13_11945 [Vibrio parahaemolyticus]|uniref:hypothetical protein n=1 Tax=Vibrio harveyi group TaxID=717610 RepID=UPI000812C326|nr:hypothetical protein [Vibrio parahaemolyticus]EGQ8231943.1 hypothetical protein [Vibrio parahaemolyticus]OCP67488.1 hypothetical protein AKH08_19440 [Vibrio parahaemolyticus]ODX82655.1 hypothetical protein BBM12_01545 [Vibrio parahaemolyticus]ODX85360.1 hypothetical protein BBM93_12980 [Vibrio parahaemolyticus]ODX88689.1 hypothetical protein BBM13_11945 [Vibrio parahaemolyticus]
MRKVRKGKTTELKVVLGNGVHSRRLRQDLKVIAKRHNIDKARLAGKLMKYVIHHRKEFALVAEMQNMVAETPRFKTGEVMVVRVDSHTKTQMTRVSIDNHHTKTQVYSKLLNIAIAKATKEPEWLDSIITSVDPIDPWPNDELKKELK